MNDTDTKIAAFLQDQLFVDEEYIKPDTLLFSDGIVDSFSLIEIIQFIEESEGIEVVQDEVNLDNFDSIRRIAKYIDEKKASA